MLAKTELDRFNDDLRGVTQSLAKKRFWSLLREQVAAHPRDAAGLQSALRAAANEVARLSEPSARIELNGQSASSLLRAIAEAGQVEPQAFGGVEGRGPDGSLVIVSPFETSEALFAFAFKRRGEEPTFVDGYFYRTGPELMDRLSETHGPDSPWRQQMAQFVADAGRAATDRPLPPLADAIVARTQLPPAA